MNEEVLKLLQTINTIAQKHGGYWHWGLPLDSAEAVKEMYLAITDYRDDVMLITIQYERMKTLEEIK